MSAKGILAIFVKTPGLSPVKTRLAVGIGQLSALGFYSHSVAAMTALGRNAQSLVPNLDICWAVAEHEAISAELWSEFPTVFQGSGGLGARLSRVYDSLLRRYDYVCFMGADSPHLHPKLFAENVLKTSETFRDSFVMGDTVDGGFYFFGGGKPIDSKIWTDVEYSTDRTAVQLREGLQSLGSVLLMEPDFDIDTVDDLRRYGQIEMDQRSYLPEQRKLLKWVKSLL